MMGAPTKTSFVSTIHERNGKVYFASVMNPTILVLDNQNRKELSVFVESQDL